VENSELEANIVPAATGTDGLLATAWTDVGYVATDAGKGGVDAAVVRQEHVAPIIPCLQAKQDDRAQAGQESQEDGEIDGL
jgi:hypothetical protein